MLHVTMLVIAAGAAAGLEASSGQRLFELCQVAANSALQKA